MSVDQHWTGSREVSEGQKTCWNFAQGISLASKSVNSRIVHGGYLESCVFLPVIPEPSLPFSSFATAPFLSRFPCCIFHIFTFDICLKLQLTDRITKLVEKGNLLPFPHPLPPQLLHRNPWNCCGKHSPQIMERKCHPETSANQTPAQFWWIGLQLHRLWQDRIFWTKPM